MTIKNKFMENQKRCSLCNCEFIEKNKIQYGTEGADCHISRHHCFPKRFGKFFKDNEIKEKFNIESKKDTVTLCYYCHEEMLHNIVLNDEIINNFAKKMKGKNIKERILMLHKQLLWNNGVRSDFLRNDFLFPLRMI